MQLGRSPRQHGRFGGSGRPCPRSVPAFPPSAMPVRARFWKIRPRKPVAEVGSGISGLGHRLPRSVFPYPIPDAACRGRFCRIRSRTSVAEVGFGNSEIGFQKSEAGFTKTEVGFEKSEMQNSVSPLFLALSSEEGQQRGRKASSPQESRRDTRNVAGGAASNRERNHRIPAPNATRPGWGAGTTPLPASPDGPPQFPRPRARFPRPLRGACPLWDGDPVVPPASGGLHTPANFHQPSGLRGISSGRSRHFGEIMLGATGKNP